MTIFQTQLLQQGISNLEILDTAVKIGIGALISGVSTYFVTRLQQKGEIEKERGRRQAELLEGIAQQVEIINHIYLKYWAFTTDAIKRKRSKKPVSKDKQQEREDIKTELFHAFKELTNAEAKLMLIGETKALHLMRDYGESVANFRKVVNLDNENISEEEIQQWKDKIFEYRRQFFDELSKIYKKI